jgi:hypothetical protein
MTEQLVAIEITQEDIDRGVKMDCYQCPISLSLNRMYPKMRAGVAGPFVFIFGELRRELEADACDDMIDFIHQFDTGQPVKPMTVHMIPIEKENT